ncbi:MULTISPECIES: MgtC/SapB family protein [Pandoraea]|uniref:Putative transmembrane protein n=1 Tax=Pandoraea communis TaxID=2508297 RepID=A0A5E4YG25_9BURK|nr:MULTISPECIES: MgtC/SapB family protein [Pandoraea]EON15275.1 putative transmembrane protein [Pandoraea sp. SD6-2]VVE47674.1 putative transmembrane protein [Pandoraea communis]
MTEPVLDLLPYATALAAGLLIGAERERRKGTTRERAAAGIRTFALTSVLGAVAMSSGGVWLLIAVVLALCALLTAAYMRPHDDPGITTEIGLILTLLLGATAQRNPALSIAIAVAVACVMQVRFHLHHLVTRMVTEAELQDMLVLAVAALVILPILPDRAIDTFYSLNPYTIWRFTVVMLSIAVIGHFAQRALGPSAGLPVTGFVSGFASSIATISAMGSHVKRNPELLLAAAAGAVLSTIATMIQLGIVIGTIFPSVLIDLALPLGAGASMALAYALWALWRASRQATPQTVHVGGGIDMRSALVLTASVSLVMLASGVLSRWFGNAGLLAVAMAGGLADAHSVAASVTSLAEQGRLSAAGAALPILAGASTNAFSKGVVALLSGGPRFAKIVVPGLVLVMGAVWLGYVFSPAYR